jgi:hypothetical protein
MSITLCLYRLYIWIYLYLIIVVTFVCTWYFLKFSALARAVFVIVASHLLLLILICTEGFEVHTAMSMKNSVIWDIII